MEHKQPRIQFASDARAMSKNSPNAFAGVRQALSLANEELPAVLDLSYHGGSASSDDVERVERREALHQTVRYMPEIRRTLFALEAVLIREIIARIIKKKEERPPHGLVNRLEHYGPEAEKLLGHKDMVFVEMQMTLTHTLCHEARNLFHELQNQNGGSEPSDALRETFCHFGELEKILDPYWKGRKLPRMFEGGLSNNAEVMTKILQVIPKVYLSEMGEVGSPKVLTEIAKNSYSLLSRLSVEMLLESFLDLRETLKGDIEVQEPGQPFLSDHFSLSEKRNGEGLQLTLSDSMENFLRQKKEGVFGNMAVAGCPAAISFDGKPSAVRQMWDWCVEMGDFIYQRNFPIKQS